MICFKKFIILEKKRTDNFFKIVISFCFLYLTRASIIYLLYIHVYIFNKF